MPAPYPQEFREDVVRVAQSREDGVTHTQIAKDFGIHEMTLHKWIRQADIDDGNRPGKTREDSAIDPGVSDGLCKPYREER